ncbi:alpha-1,2-Mannosidase-2 [Coleophoma crateriformis]|uniref:alpha-1,2-Mannosidase n=1 Tax=Coleophoma crateriformis TaxID=565419 RepID=A0A3D8QUU8_9HELO|nr:alpha-1,2-Mannosidase-2 [Coleophoma crateriformis]
MVFGMRRWRATTLFAICFLFGLYRLHESRKQWDFTPSPLRLPSGYDKPPAKHDGLQHWHKRKERYPVTSHIQLPSGSYKQIPQIQAKPPTESPEAKAERLRRKAAVKQSFEHSWKGYKKHAWLKDEVTPNSGQWRDTFGGWAATLVDALDTLWIMGLKDDFEAAVKAAWTIDFSYTPQQSINVFETTIRYMGGFLAAYDISGGQYEVLLYKAVEVADLLMGCFDTPNRMPISRWDWRNYVDGYAQKAPSAILVSELGSLSLEFTRLTQLTGDPKYYDAVQRISDVLANGQNTTKLPGMWPVSVDAQTPSFDSDNMFTLGGMSDSLYEYLPKQYLLLGGLLEQPKIMYEKFIDVAKKELFFRILNPKDEDLTISGDVRASSDPNTAHHRIPRGQHLTCFTGGMVGMSAKIFNRPEELKLAEELTNGCVWAYDSLPHGVAAEIFSVIPCPKDGSCKYSDDKWHDAIVELYPAVGLSPDRKAAAVKAVEEHRLFPGYTSINDRRYILRPEAIESVFYMYRLTGNSTWADTAWRMFQAVEKLSRTSIAASAIDDITMPEPTLTDSMESFWLAETLKYFYLCFEDWDVVDLDTYVLNTEAHPLKRYGG